MQFDLWSWQCSIALILQQRLEDQTFELLALWEAHAESEPSTTIRIHFHGPHSEPAPFGRLQRDSSNSRPTHQVGTIHTDYDRSQCTRIRHPFRQTRSVPFWAAGQHR